MDDADDSSCVCSERMLVCVWIGASGRPSYELTGITEKNCPCAGPRREKKENQCEDMSMERNRSPYGAGP